MPRPKKIKIESEPSTSEANLPEEMIDVCRDELLLKCAICPEKFFNQLKFKEHNAAKHNMLSWVEGDIPVDINDKKTVLSILNQVLKQKKGKKVFKCDTCEAEKKSAVGFYSHKMVCQKSNEEREQMRVTCTICSRTVLPVSLYAHMQAHEKVVEAKEMLESTDITGKRAAATKAQKKLKEFVTDLDFLPESTIRKPKLRRFYAKLAPAKSGATLLREWKRSFRAHGTGTCPHPECPYVVQNISQMDPHLASCDFTPHDTVFSCKSCLLLCKTEAEMLDHVLVHANDEDEIRSEGHSSGSEEFSSGDEGVRVENSLQQLVRFKKAFNNRVSNRIKFLASEITPSHKNIEPYIPTLKWTYNFRLANYSESLFPNFHTDENDWIIIENESAAEYLPGKSTSVLVESNGDGLSRRFSLFESDNNNDVSTFFAGGPVWASAWCPLPLKWSFSADCETRQFLAVSTHHDMDSFHVLQKCYATPNVIQLWDCGKLDDESPAEKPKFALGLAHNHGTVWCLEWCPSGAFNTELNAEDSLQRLGLLAAACSDGTIPIYSICVPTQLKTANDRELPIYKVEPALTLVGNFPENSQCTRVCWYPGKNHWLIVGGFCNGMVACWDISTLSPFLWDSNNCTLRPYHCFQAHLSVVTALSLSPDGNARFLMTGSYDRSIKFWDLEDTSTPVSMHRKGVVTDGTWMSHWLTCVTSHEDAFMAEHSNALIHPIRDFGYKSFHLLHQNSIAWGLSYNEWINAIAQGSQAGEVLINLPYQIFVGLDTEKPTLEKRLMLSFTQLKKLKRSETGEETLCDLAMWKTEEKPTPKKKNPNGAKSQKANPAAQASDKMIDSEHESKPRMYDDAVAKYGITLHNILKDENDSYTKVPNEAITRSKLTSRIQNVWADLYPLTSVNTVRWNPNGGSFIWLACGHHCGLVRLIRVSYLLSKSVETFLNELKSGNLQCL